MKENRKPGRMAVDLLLIFIVFLVIQMVVNGLVTLVYVYLNHVDAAQLAQQVASGQQGQFVAATSVLSSLLTILVYPRLRSTPSTAPTSAPAPGPRSCGAACSRWARSCPSSGSMSNCRYRWPTPTRPSSRASCTSPGAMWPWASWRPWPRSLCFAAASCARCSR